MKKLIMPVMAIILAAVDVQSCTSPAEKENTTPVVNQTEAVINNIMSRRSIRKYIEQPISRDTLDKIIECGINAPNGKNEQNYEVKVVDDLESAGYLAENLDGLYKAPVYMFIAAKNSYDMSRIDVGLLSENICLSAWAYGIGSINLGMPVRSLKEKPEILKKLGFSEGHELCLILALGYPDETPEAKPRNAERVQFVTLTQKVH